MLNGCIYPKTEKNSEHLLLILTITIKKGSLCGLIMVDVDSLDRAILAYLRDAGRAPFVDLSLIHI